MIFNDSMSIIWPSFWRLRSHSARICCTILLSSVSLLRLRLASSFILPFTKHIDAFCRNLLYCVHSVRICAFLDVVDGEHLLVKATSKLSELSDTMLHHIGEVAVILDQLVHLTFDDLLVIISLLGLCFELFDLSFSLSRLWLWFLYLLFSSISLLSSSFLGSFLSLLLHYLLSRSYLVFIQQASNLILFILSKIFGFLLIQKSINNQKTQLTFILSTSFS